MRGRAETCRVADFIDASEKSSIKTKILILIHYLCIITDFLLFIN